MTTETILIKVREDGSRVVSRNIDDIGDSADKTAGALSAMTTILKAVASAAILTALGRMADTYTTIQNKLRLVTTGTENLTRVTKELQGIANLTRTDFESTAELYSRVAGAAKDLGLSQKQLLGFTKSLNQAVVLSGASASEAAGGLRQLAQGLASGTLRGDELNSVMENFPKVADIIAQSVGVTRGELRAMGADGKISADTIIKAFAEASETLDKEFATTVPTLSQAFTVMKNNILIAVGELDQSLGLTKALAEGLVLVSNNLKPILALLGAVAAALAVAFAPTAVLLLAGFITGTLIPQVKLLFGLIMAHPFLALATAIAAVTTYLVIMRDEIKLGVDDTTTLGDLMRSAWEGVQGAVGDAWTIVSGFFKGTADESKKWSGEIIIHSGEAIERQEAGWLKLVRTVAQVFDAIAALVRGTISGISEVVSRGVGLMMDSFRALGDVASAAFSGSFDEIPGIVDAHKDNVKSLGGMVGTIFADAYNEQAGRQMESGLESILDSTIKRAQEISKARQTKDSPLAPGGANNIKPPVDADAAKKAARELERLKDALANVLDAADPVGAATRRLAEAQDILNRAVAAGLINQKDATAAYNNLKESMQDQLDPLGALNRMLDENIALLKLGSAERQIEADMLAMTENLRRDGVKLTQDETAALRAKLVVEQELTKLAQARDSLEANSGATQFAEFMTNVQAMQDALNDVKSTFGSADIASELSNLLPWANLEGTQEQMMAYVQAHADMFAQIKALEDASIINSQTAGMLRNQADRQLLEQRLQHTRAFFGTLAQLSTSENKKLAAIGKAAAIVQATIDGVLAVQKTMAETPYPYNIPLAAAQAALAAANVAQIASTGFRTGGSMTVGGSGGPDSQMVAFRATPGEKINVNTPSQARAAEQPQGMGDVTVPVTVINVDDPQRAVDAMDTAAGKSVVMNHMQSDPAAFKRALGIA